MTDENTSQVLEDQRATDPRLELQNQVPDTPQDDNQDQASQDESVDQTQNQDPPVPPTKPRKSTEEVLKGRVGHLTKIVSAKDQELANERSLRIAAEALLATSGRVVADGAPELPTGQPEPSTRPTTPPTYTQEQFDAAVSAKTEVDAFNHQADQMYSQGQEKFTDWKDSVDTLVASGFMDKNLLDAALAVDDGASVIHYLGVNLDEAERISALSPIRKAAELAKLSSQINAPVHTPVSSAPTPIRPVNGSPSPVIDLQRAADSNDMREYVASRAKMGSRWAQPRGQRG